MNDEGVGVAGWLLADLTLVLALLFLSLVPAAALPSAPDGEGGVPVIRDLGCGGPPSAVRCEPEVEGRGPFAYDWYLSPGGEPDGSLDGAILTAAFGAGGGWLRLTVTGAAGQSEPRVHRVAAALPQADFSFDQIVLDAGGEADADGLAAAAVRAGVSKDAELDDGDFGGGEAAGDWLRRKRDACWRIALVETFSHPGHSGATRFADGVARSEEINDALFGWLADEGGEWFHGGADAVRSEGSAAYYGGPHGSRVNLFFVRGQDCSAR